MKFKLDENLGQRCRQQLTEAGHDVATVAEQQMSGAADQELYEACRQEERCLVTLDLDFANPFRSPPADSAGIAVLRLPNRPGPDDLQAATRTLVRALEMEVLQQRKGRPGK